MADLHNVPSVPSQGLQGSRPWVHPGGASVLAGEKAAAHRNAPSGGITSPTTTTTSPALSTPLVGEAAIDADQSQCVGCYPPDGAIAVGPNHVVGAVNTAVGVWDKSGNVVIAPVSLPNFFSTDPNCANDFLHAFSDPFVVYDPQADQFLLGMLNFDLFYDSTLCVAATQAHDPTGQWYLYDFPVNLSSTLFDFPRAAVNSGVLYITGNLFQNGSTFLGARVYAIDTSTMYPGSPPESPAKVVQDVQQKSSSGDPVDTLNPAWSVATSNVMYFTAVDNCNSCNAVRLWKWDSPFGGNTFTYQGAAQIQSYVQPPEAAQPGGNPIATNDTRVLAAYWHDGTIFGVHAIGCDPGGGTVACSQWFQLGNVDGAPTLLQQGIVGSSGQNRFFPTLAVDNSGDMSVGYAYSSSSDYAGIRYTGLTAGGATLEPEQLLVTGQTAITTTGTYGRYGDFGGEAVDPSNGCTIWHLEEYAQAGHLWGTWLGAFTFNGCGSSATPDFSLSASPGSQAVIPGGTASYTVSLSALNGFTGSATLSATGLPAGANASFTPDSVANGAPSALTITTDAATTPGGSYSVTITGTSNGLSHQTTVELDVQDFTIAAAPVTLNLTAGSSGSSTLTLSARGGYGSTVNLAVTSALPTGMTAGINPSSVVPSASGSNATLSIGTSASTPVGQYTVTVTGTGTDGVTHATSVTVNVSSAPPDFSIAVTPSSRSVSGGGSTSYSVTVTSINGYSGVVTLSVGGLPKRATTSWSPSASLTVPANGSVMATLTIRTQRTPRGSFTLTITGTGSGGSPFHSVNATLNVTR